MKHAYLIIAHDEFFVLQSLLDALDDERNDIYVHIDKTVKEIPILKSQLSRLMILDNRIDVRWGHVSQIEAEYVLFEAAYADHQKYGRYQLISGTHMPLKSQDEIHDFFQGFENKEVLSCLYTDNYEVNFKTNRFHFFVRNYRDSRPFVATIAQFLWHVLLKIQVKLGIQKKHFHIQIKANNWVSLTSQAVDYIIQEKNEALKVFHYSFCGDEFFVPYLLEKASDRFQMVDEKRLLFNDFAGGSTPRTITEKDYDFLTASDYLFARKFSATDRAVVDKILATIKSN